MTSMTSRTEYSTQTQKTSTLFSGRYLRNHWTLDIGVLGYIVIVWPKEHSPEVRSFPPGTSCIYIYIYTHTHTHTQSAPHWRMRQHGIARKIQNTWCYALIAAGSNTKARERRVLVEPSGESCSGGQVLRTVRCHNVYPSARPDLRSRIRHRNLTTNKIYNDTICPCINSDVPFVLS